MKDMTVFTYIESEELEWRGQCAALPTGAIPVAMIAGNTLVILGSPHHYEEDILSYVEHVLDMKWSEEDHDAAKDGRCHVYGSPSIIKES
jgi:hypothetical protein